MNMNTLEDKLLVTIFSYLPISDLLQLGQICHKWSQLQPTVCQSITRLYIQIHGPYGPLTYHRFTIPHIEDLEEPRPNFAQTLPLPSIDYKSPVERLALKRLYLKTAQKIAQQFPNISHFEISVESILPLQGANEDEEVFAPIIELISSWSSTLVTLQIFNRFCSFTGYVFDSTFKRLIASINACTNLKHLTLEILDHYDFLEEETPTVNLPIIRQLKSFYLNFTQLTAQMWTTNLEVYDSSNLHSIGLGWISKHDLNEEHLCNVSRYGELYSKMNFFELFHIKPKPLQLGLIASRFPALKRIGISFNQLGKQFYELVGLVAPLKQLLCLDLHLYLDDKDEPPTDDQQQPIPRLETLRILHIVGCLRSHQEMSSIPWTEMFPNVEILLFSQIYSTCSSCQGGGSNGEKQWEVCLKLVVNHFKQTCPHLKKVYCADFWEEKEIEV